MLPTKQVRKPLKTPRQPAKRMPVAPKSTPLPGSFQGGQGLPGMLQGQWDSKMSPGGGSGINDLLSSQAARAMGSGIGQGRERVSPGVYRNAQGGLQRGNGLDPIASPMRRPQQNAGMDRSAFGPYQIGGNPFGNAVASEAFQRAPTGGEFRPAMGQGRQPAMDRLQGIPGITPDMQGYFRNLLGQGNGIS